MGQSAGTTPWLSACANVWPGSPLACVVRRRLEGDGTRPIGALTVNLHKASNLPRMDRFGKVRVACLLGRHRCGALCHRRPARVRDGSRIRTASFHVARRAGRVA